MPITSITKQSGNSIVSLMISVVISLLGFTASFQLFSTMLIIDSQQGKNNNLLSQASNAKMLLEMEITQAGYGLEAATPDTPKHIVYIAASNSLVWRYEKTKDEIVCTGIKDSLFNDQSRQIQRLIPESAADCNGSNDLESISFVSESVIANIEQSDAWLTSADFNDSTCWPFSADNAQKRHQITLEYYLDSDADYQQDSSSTLCLLNSKY